MIFYHMFSKHPVYEKSWNGQLSSLFELVGLKKSRMTFKTILRSGLKQAIIFK